MEDKNMYKKIISGLLSLLTIGTVAITPVNAFYDSDCSKPVTISSYENDIAPYYTNLGMVTAGMSITSDNRAYCSGAYFVYDDMKTSVTITLLKSLDGQKSWSAVTGQNWSNSFSTYGTHSCSGTSSITLSSRYYYCSLTEVTVYDSNGKAIEAANCYSNVYHI